VDLFRSALELYQGWHPFHNFTNRAQYQTKRRAIDGKGKGKGGKGKAEDEGELEGEPDAEAEVEEAAVLTEMAEAGAATGVEQVRLAVRDAPSAWSPSMYA
jgi:hypothetical protein